MTKVPRKPSLEHLKSLRPAVKIVEPGQLFWRVYFRCSHHPTKWSDLRHVGPVDARFDHHLGDRPTQQARAVLYMASDPVIAIAEVFQKTRVINRWHKEPWLVGFELAAPVHLLDLSGSFVTRASASMGLMTGARSVGRNWSRGFYAAYPEIEGLWYPSSMHANQPAIMLNDRAAAAGVIPPQSSFHRAFGDPAILSLVKNAAYALGYALN